MTGPDYDVIVIGAGSPGEHCAGDADGGLRVAVVERELAGGECSYWACIPAALAWRDFMVSEYPDAVRQRRLKDNGIDLARGPLPVLRDVIQPFPTFSEIYVTALKALHNQISTARTDSAHRPM